MRNKLNKMFKTHMINFSDKLLKKIKLWEINSKSLTKISNNLKFLKWKKLKCNKWNKWFIN